MSRVVVLVDSREKLENEISLILVRKNLILLVNREKEYKLKY